MKKKTLFVALVLLVQLAAIGFLVVRYERVVSQGTEVRFKCQAYDPYDPLRGRYLRTTVREETTNVAVGVGMDDLYRWRGKVVVKIEPATNGLWRVTQVAEKPLDGGVWAKPTSSHFDYRMPWSEKKKDESYEDFRKRRSADGIKVTVTFPDQLFVSERIAPEAEKILREKTGDAVAVYRVRDGEIVITDIEIKGKSILQCAREKE